MVRARALDPATAAQFGQEEADFRAREAREAERLGAIASARGASTLINQGRGSIEAVRELGQLRSRNPIAEKLIEAHKARILTLPKDVREAAELVLQVTANATELIDRKNSYIEAVRKAKADASHHLVLQALKGTPVDEWKAPPEPKLPSVAGGDIDIAIEATRTAKARLENAFLDYADYDAIYPLLVEAYDKKVGAVERADRKTTSMEEFDKLTKIAVEASRVLTSINEAFFVTELDGKTRRTLRAHSQENGGLTHIEDYKRAQRGVIRFEDVRCKLGDPEINPGAQDLGDFQLVGAEDGDETNAA